MKRKLTKEEKKACEKSLAVLAIERDTVTTERMMANARLDYEINYHFKLEKDRWAKKKKDAQEHFNFVDKKIKILQDQLTNGVEIKNKEEK